MEKPSVTIELAPYLHDYLYHEFGCRKEGGVMVAPTNDLGKMIQSMVTIKDRPPRLPLKENPITLYLPTQEWNHFILNENFLCIREYFVAGYEKGFKQDKIIKAFLMAYNIKNNAINYDAVKKYDYRNRKKMIKEVNKEIQLSLF